MFRSYRPKRSHALVALLIVIAIAVLGAILLSEGEQELYVALFGRIRNTPYAAIHRHALEHYLESLSDEVPGYRFKLVPAYLDDPPGPADDPGTLQRLYQTVIADDPRYVVVIDNTWAKHLQQAASIVRQEEIPTLSLNADKGEADFGHQAIFIGHADKTPLDLVTYLNEVIRPATVVFVGERDYWLTGEFLKLTQGAPNPADRPHLKHDHIETVGTAQTTENERRQLQTKLATWFEAAPQPAVLLLNVHNDWGDEILDYVDGHLENVLVLAPTYASREGKSERFGGNRGNRLILMTEPEDAVSKRVRQDILTLGKRLPPDSERRFNLAFYVKRCLDASEILREAVMGVTRQDGGKNVTIDRKLFSDFFQHRVIGQSVAGRYDLYSFDGDGLVVPEVSFVEYKGGFPTSQWQQLNSRRQVIPTVFFGFDLLDIGRLDPANGRFRADFYYWIRAESAGEADAAPEGSTGRATVAGRPVSDFIHFRNLSEKNSTTLIDEAADGSYRLERISGEFNVDLELKDYPLDTQELTLELELANPFDDVRVAFDYAEFNDARRNIESFEIPGWKLVDHYVTVDNAISRGLRGANPGQLREPRKFKTLTVRILTKRKIQGALISVALPLCAIGLAALSLLFIRDVRFARVGDVYVGLFLSIVTYSIAFAQLSPPSGVMTRADVLFYFTFLVVLLVFLRFVVLNVLDRVPPSDVARPRRVLGYSALGAYVLVVLLLVVL